MQLKNRIKKLNRARVISGEYVLYWMQQAQRAEENHALEYAIYQANQQDKMVVVVFSLTNDSPDANLRHYTFMLEGLNETRKSLEKRGIRMIFRIGHPVKEVLDIGRKASMIVCDRGYLRHQRAWRKAIAEKSGCPVVQVETDVVIPVEQVSDKAEYAAYTIRPKISRQLDQYLTPIEHIELRNPSLEIALKSTELERIKTVLKDLNVDDSIQPVSHIFRGGTSEAKARFDVFLDQHFSRYAVHRNEPKYLAVSCMSPYLHFGQISPLYLALKIKACKNEAQEAAAAYLEELIVRRELAANFVYFNPYYDSLGCLPAWPTKTLAEHEKDVRDPVYTKSQLIACRTHDEYWNAAMKEMIVTGFMHNYMRMYWGKKILEWSPTPLRAYETMIDLNNAYFLDGRDPNSYAGVGWIFGLHDRAWFERPIFGKVRYMAASGLERKCDIKGYVDRVKFLI
ncbi:DNA deoxyribo-dipyrimidine photolyase family protein [Desulforapulum autotrophicum HRM2]|uniref:Deoxyribodipyrimidine photo-lyase n=1 Tax=Desulforapulum autotrophicum (strain ATCC 43914 / DSM 3382 / VKM B-1955 / HRM2) TaxID=177437 RepID=C0QBL6_DESAH|nr:deoxyribodipyrimidine photo-lyase [Desulforapulum autotrophicum]ACN17018.1 DNA deoxyribo-dipyrimidine photolyase family protein [Desulforapulum autotrophicum HRM2]